jgi:hypothetical protein
MKKPDPIHPWNSTSEQVLRMRSFVLIKFGAALVVGVVGLGACGQPTAESCPRAIGTFTGQYSFISGTCEPSFQGRELQLEKDDPGNTVRKVNNLSDSVTTEINLIGCTIGVKQEITDTAGVKKISDINGDLNVEDASALSGEIARTEYMPDGTTVRCTAQYNATYTLDGAVIGTAAQHALSSP